MAAPDTERDKTFEEVVMARLDSIDGRLDKIVSTFIRMAESFEKASKMFSGPLGKLLGVKGGRRGGAEPEA